MTVVWFVIGLWLGITLGWLLKGHGEKKEDVSLEDTWRKLLDEAGERLEPGQALVMQVVVNKEPDGEPVGSLQNWRYN